MKSCKALSSRKWLTLLLSKSLNDTKDWRFMLKIFLSDFSFFILFSLVFRWFFLEVIPLIESVNQIIAQIGSVVPIDNAVPDAQSFSAMTANYHEIYALSAALFRYFVLLIICTFALWCIFQGTSWWLAHRKAGHNISWCRFQARFSFATFIYLALFFFAVIILLKLSNAAVISSAELIGISAAAYPAMLLGYIIIYFALFSYAVLHQGIGHAARSAYSFSIRKAGTGIPVFIFITIFLAAAYYAVRIISYLAGFDIFWTVLLGIMIFIPLLAWARLLIMRCAMRQ